MLSQCLHTFSHSYNSTAYLQQCTNTYLKIPLHVSTQASPGTCPAHAGLHGKPDSQSCPTVSICSLLPTLHLPNCTQANLTCFSPMLPLHVEMSTAQIHKNILKQIGKNYRPFLKEYAQTHLDKSFILLRQENKK